jgi:Uma2 family endonuclease
MPVTFTETVALLGTETGAPLGPPRKLWTRAELSALVASGVVDGQHVELIAGELINKMGKNWPHVSSVALLRDWLIGVFGGPFVIQEAPIDVAPEDNPTNEPEPDIIVLKRPASTFVQTGQPRPEDLHLIVEVADTTLRFDLTTKAALYARAGIAEYWVLDVTGKRLIVHREPQRGVYTSVLEFGQQESVAPLAAPHAQLELSSALLF